MQNYFFYINCKQNSIVPQQHMGNLRITMSHEDLGFWKEVNSSFILQTQ